MTRRVRPEQRSQNEQSGDNMRLRDLIPALRAQHHSASGLLQRINPAITDELRAYAAHRQIHLTDLAADCLEDLVSDTADAIWQIGIERHGDFDNDPEVALLGNILRMAVQTRLQQEYLIGSGAKSHMVIIGFTRLGHPYPVA